MNTSVEELMQLIGSLFVENKLLALQVARLTETLQSINPAEGPEDAPDVH